MFSGLSNVVVIWIFVGLGVMVLLFLGVIFALLGVFTS